MKKICPVDGTEFEAKRSTAVYCSTNCRVKAANKASVDPETGEVLPASIQSGAQAASPLGPKSTPVKSAGKLYNREANLKAFIKMGVAETNWISTGIPEFDELTKIPRGRVTQIQGRYGVGKTTLALNMVQGLTDKRVLYIDTEAALNPLLLVDLELNPKRFTLYNESNYIEEVAEVIREGAKSGDYDLIVLDSVPMTTTKTISDGKITDSNIGQKAKILHKLMEVIAMDLKKTDTAMVFINQERDVIGGYVPQIYTPGGTAIPFQASLIIALKTIKSWRFPDKPKDNMYLGHEVEATIIKSKVNQPWRKKKFKLYYPNPAVKEEDVHLNSKPAF